jgi:tryptophan synthase alpha chain
VCYLTGGDPSVDATVELVCAVADAGADVIEIGVPFSDPVADGPTIQASTHRALAAGATVAGLLDAVRRIRARSSVPLVAMSYVNPIMQYGMERFARDFRDAGLDGVILTDLPAEEADDWVNTARSAALDTIFLVTPTSTPERLRAAGRRATGFLYCVSRMGVTGAQTNLASGVMDLVTRARQAARCPVCVGFGISAPDHVRALAGAADGVVVGSALVAAIADAANLESGIEAARSLVGSLRAASHRVR